MSKHGVVVLTRGYTHINGYADLVHRNRTIFDNFYSKLLDQPNYDVIIFHEGNIHDLHQQYIRSCTPNMPLEFRKVDFVNNVSKNYALCPPSQLSEYFTLGYKNMCYFWSITFLEYLKDYDYIIRIDEDCTIHSIDPNVIQRYKEQDIHFSSPYFTGEDEPNVTIGMKRLFHMYLMEKRFGRYKTEIRCPYTNVMIVDIQYFRNTRIVGDVLKKIKECNCIFSNRWGDLPIWGYILSYLIEPRFYLEDKTISYRHASHNIEINISSSC